MLTGAKAFLPPLSTDLVDELNKLHPERCMREGETLEAHSRYAGKRELINFLIQLRDNPPQK
jgi:hypothetical protein